VSGSILGVLDGARVRAWTPLSSLKVEGLARRDGEVYFVTDGDDRATRSTLLRGRDPWA
jgi:hypothetical protein